MKRKTVAIVLAAGRGSRMKSDIQKQYMQLQGFPVLYYSLKAFEQSEEIDDIVLVTGEVEYCKEQLVKNYGFTKVRMIVTGGAERYLSVLNAILAIQDKGYERVLIHDGARPFVNQEIISRCIDGIDDYKACVAAMPVKDTIKVVDSEGWASYTPERKTLWQVQTPQAFEARLIIEAYTQLKKRIEVGEELAITDDAMVVETCMNQKVKMVEGDYRNLKITTPEDLVIAEALMKG
jgi:2-C-methyl-D-erythritol 4-phosphate cytidylyltransferase